jgi:hypothetical protein
MLPLVTDKFTALSCFKKVFSFPIDYKANRNVWVITNIFSQWLLEVGLTLGREKRKILLLAESCSSHSVDVRLGNMDFFSRPFVLQLYSHETKE